MKSISDTFLQQFTSNQFRIILHCCNLFQLTTQYSQIRGKAKELIKQFYTIISSQQESKLVRLLSAALVECVLIVQHFRLGFPLFNVIIITAMNMLLLLLSCSHFVPPRVYVNKRVMMLSRKSCWWFMMSRKYIHAYNTQHCMGAINKWLLKS